MAFSPSNHQSEPAKIEQIITEFFAKSLHIIHESRYPYVSSRNYSGEQAVSSPSSSSSSSSARHRDKWFNLALRECAASLENLVWRQSNFDPLVIDVILVQGSQKPDTVHHYPVSKGSPLRNPLLKDRFLGGWNAGQEEFISETKHEKIIERWVVQYDSRKNSGILRDLSSASKKLGSSTSFNSSETPASFYKKTYKKAIILLRSLYVTVRLLPAYKLFRDLNSSGQIRPFSLTCKVNTFVQPFTRREEAEMQQFSFAPVDTYCGRLCLSVSYRPSLLDVSSEPSTPISTQFISDYVGSPTTDPLRRLPSLSSTRSPTSLSPATITRWHSWNDLRRAAPSLSPSPSPTYSDSRTFASNPNSHHLPPRGHMNLDYSPPVRSPYHVLPETPCSSNASLVHKKNVSFDEYFPSPPFSPSPSPSPPTHLPGGHLSNLLMRSESAPVNIPSARTGRSRGLPNSVLPPSPSPKGTGHGCSLRSYNVGSQASRTSLRHSSPPESKYQTKHDPLGSGGLQSGIAVQKMLSFGKDEVGNFPGAKRPFSRSSSRLSFPDEFEDSEFACPFAVDDDDLTDPCNRSESYEGKRHIGETLEPGGLLPVRKSQDAAIGSLVHMLQTAAPLRQDLSNSAKFSEVSRVESCSSRIQHYQNTEFAGGSIQAAASNTGITGSGLLALKTTADAFEDLRSYREMKELLLRQGGYQSLDPPQTSKTPDKGT